MLEKLRSICINQYNFALNNVGRFIPPSLAHKYPRIKTPYMHAMYNHYGNRLTIDEIIERNTNHSIMIVGCGGSGKTYTLIEFAGKLLKSDVKTLPFYVPLNDFNFNTSSIVDYAAEQLRAENEPNYKTCFMEWLRTDHDEKIMFLLDGFNEITSSEIQVRVLDEIKRLHSLYNCVRFVITSRYDMSSSLVSGAVSPFVSYAVDELSSETVKDYIKVFFENYGNVEDIIANAMISENDDTVKHFLRNPMALVMYCFMNCNDTNELYIPHKDYCTTGELIENYVFLIKKINETQYAINEKASDFLRYVGYQMSNDGLFKISMRGLTQYAQEFNDIDIKQWLEVPYIKDMLKCSGNNHILSEIEFVHQNYRDFFAADYLKNILTEGNADRINKCFGDRNITSEVQILLGDILEEYKHVTKDIESGSSVIQDIITRNRHFLSPSAISTIIHIAAIARKNNLSSFDFSCVDLGSTTLNRIKLYMPGVGKAKFENSKIDKATFNALGHPGSVSSLLWLERRYIISFSKSGIFCFDMAIKKHYQIAEISKCAVRAAIPLAGKKQIITGNDFGEIILWNYEFDNETFRIEMRNTTVINGAIIHDIIEFNGKIYVSSQDGKLYIFTTADEGNYDLAILPNSSHQDRYINTNCRLTAVDDILYLSYGDTLHIYKIMSQKNELILLESNTLDNAEIIDIAGVEAESRNGVLVNLRKKSDNGDIVSQVMFYSFEKNIWKRLNQKRIQRGE